MVFSMRSHLGKEIFGFWSFYQIKHIPVLLCSITVVVDHKHRKISNSFKTVAMSFKLQPHLWVLALSIIFMQVKRGTFGAINELNGSKTSPATYGPSMLDTSDILSRSHHHHHHRHHGTHFDFLMFVQLWPITSCIDWKLSLIHISEPTRPY